MRMYRASHVKTRPRPRSVGWCAAAGALALMLAACSDPAVEGVGEATAGETLTIGGIPDQDRVTLEAMFEGMAAHLENATGLEVRYTPSTDYAAVVTAFARGDIQLAWFGGLTGVQARERVPGAEAIAQRPRDAEFRSKFIVRADLEAETLSDLEGYSFTFGSESSTSGHLMPRVFLLEAGVDPEEHLEGGPSYSGSHDRTYKLVESGTFDAGALNEAVWEAAVERGKVDTDRVRVLTTSPPYYDYNWTIHPDVEERLGPEARAEIVEALTGLQRGDDPETDELLDLFAADGFIPTENEHYEPIRRVARELGILQ